MRRAPLTKTWKAIAAVVKAVSKGMQAFLAKGYANLIEKCSRERKSAQGTERMALSPKERGPRFLCVRPDSGKLARLKLYQRGRIGNGIKKSIHECDCGACEENWPSSLADILKSWSSQVAQGLFPSSRLQFVRCEARCGQDPMKAEFFTPGPAILERIVIDGECRTSTRAALFHGD